MSPSHGYGQAYVPLRSFIRIWESTLHARFGDVMNFPRPWFRLNAVTPTSLELDSDEGAQRARACQSDAMNNA